tara:strand:+ start:9088 stop:11637 length:2550 start_codon:yes stop_codon:yes gene_type:complete
MFIAILTLLSALSISGVAIFYSVIGLATIFPGAFWPVVIMGSVLEVGKLVTASWLYRNWKHTRFLLKSYLTIAVVILSLITSMGIFGFLSKAHLEQNLAEDTVTQRIEIINGKIESQKTYIKRQQLVIDRAEKSLVRTNVSNSDAIELEKQSLKDVQDKFKTLLAVETNAVKELNARMTILDKDVSDVLKSNKSFFNEEKAAAELKASQKEERNLINVRIAEAQKRIAGLKQDYANDTSVITARIDKLRAGVVDDKSDETNKIAIAEENILNAQNNIDDLIIEREPLEAKMIKLEAEVGPVKYIAALVVDWGVTSEVNTSEAVRWVILIIIFVFDPLAVLLLVAANQSLIRKFPVEVPKPQAIVDLEKPDDEDITLKWNDVVNKQDAVTRMEEATAQLQEWKDKLESFNTKRPKPEQDPVEIIQDKDPNDTAWGEGVVVPEKKTEEKEIVVDKEKQLEEFKQREIDEQKALEQYALNAKIKDGFDPAEVEGFEEFNSNYDKKEAPTNKPALTEVIESEVAVKPIVSSGTLGVVYTKDKKVVEPPKPSQPIQAELNDEERKQMLDDFHKKHGRFEDISSEELKVERDESNRAQYLADVGLSKEEAESQPPITESRMAFFEDMIDDILRGDTTFENVPEENRKIIAQIMDPELPNPQIITKGSALKEKKPDGVEKMSAEGLKEKFMIQPDIEDRPMTDAELDALLEGFDEENKIKPGQKTRMVIKDGRRIFVPINEDEYVQNEEQNDQTLWQKTKELDIPEPEKNEIILPELPNESEEIPELVENINIEQIIPDAKFEKYKKRVTSEEDYHQRIEARINDLITKLENKEIKLSDLSENDRNVIIDILNQND